ncbi:MAG TPA: AMP-binding protein [Candidatus Limnocylindria bacterium]|nr:AMP-binding protein [Candidatus Limnocylindria bacterium]
MPYLTVPELLAHAATRFGDAHALVTREGTESFRELASHVAGVGMALRDIGLRPGDRILLVAPNWDATVHVWLGAIAAGVLPAAVNPELTVPELRYLADDLDAGAIVAEGSQAQRLGTELGRRSVELQGLGRVQASKLESAPASPLDPAAIVYTSGTTSRPKGVLVRHAAYTETGLSFPAWVGLTGRERLWACLPLFHINAQAYTLMTSLAHGYAVALTERFHASTFWTDARDLGVTSVNVVGAMVAVLARQPQDSWVPSKLRTLYAAPAPAPQERAALEERFGVRIVGGYGMSENTFGCIENDGSRSKTLSVGRPRQPTSGAFTNELRIVTPEGRDARPNEVGELLFRNPVMTPGYWNAPEVTEQLLAGGWLHTGDAGHVDASGDAFLDGRYKEMIRRRGENISPAEVEQVLLSHPAVAAAAVFGVPSELTEEDVAAVVVLVDDANVGEAELREWAARSLAPYKVPATIAFRSSLPMTPTMRVAKEALKAEYLKERT